MTDILLLMPVAAASPHSAIRGSEINLLNPFVSKNVTSKKFFVVLLHRLSIKKFTVETDREKIHINKFL